MNALSNFERRLEQFISGMFARAFRSAVQPVEIGAALQREVDNKAQILSRNRRLVPNDFHVELSPGDLERLQEYDATMVAELTETLREHAEHQSYVFPGPVRITLEQAEDLTTGRFRVRSQAQAAVSGLDTDTTVRRAKALLEINGTRHALHEPTTVVGRGTDADIRINDPGVSRRHIEFTVIRRRGLGGMVGFGGMRVEVRDLGSTNGMLVNDEKLVEAPLEHGSVVRIGTTSMTLHLVEEAEEPRG
ncbi:FhaA domain-containing protein [Nocardioides limicola]|uniref:FhaA domain-containing protein n=1 Tax=Nocardioides limicola TaxID=2803368 RepID=UPI00193B70D5|nr:DUF3662 and FHA domain-containing protein [Nocardioides sp. DJM-14]